MSIDLDAVRESIALRRWYAGADAPARLEVVDSETLRLGECDIEWLLVDDGSASYQLLLTDDGEDALEDSECARLLLAKATDGRERAEHVRPMGVEQSNTSLVFDDRLVMKLYRRVAEGANPDVEVAEALAGRGFDHVAAPVAVWRRAGRDLAVVQPFLHGAAEGWALALVSVRDLYASRVPPDQAGGDFAAESCRLGELTAAMHLVLADAFGVERMTGRPTWADHLADQVRSATGIDADREPFLARLAQLEDGGASIRVHGDYHLGQVVRADAGWFVLDFEGEPARPVAERRRKASPLKDVTGMLRSFHYATQAAMHEHEAAGAAVDGEIVELAAEWESRSRRAFLDGYLRVDGIGELLPRDPASLEVALRALELEKAVYELGYERAYRPDWSPIPLAAIEGLLTST